MGLEMVSGGVVGGEEAPRAGGDGVVGGRAAVVAGSVGGWTVGGAGEDVRLTLREFEVLKPGPST